MRLLVDLSTVPLRPEVTLVRSEDEVTCVRLDSVNVIDLEVWEIGLIADPDMGRVGDPVLVFDPGEPLPEIPVMAPDIFIRPEGGE